MTPDGREPFRPAKLVWPEQPVASQQLSDERDADEGGMISLNARHAQKKFLLFFVIVSPERQSGPSKASSVL